MRTSLLLLTAALVASGWNPSPTPAVAAASVETNDDVDFVRDVEPLLSGRCYQCHGPKKSKGKLRFDRKGTVFKEREGGLFVVVPGKPAESELLRRVSLPEEDLDVMPPEEPFLTKAEVELLRRWIAEGAAWPDPEGEDGEESETEPKDAGASLDLPALVGEAKAAAEAARARLTERGGLALPVAAGSNAMDVNLALLRDKATDADLALLSGLEPVLVWLHLGKSEVTDAGVAKLAPYRELRRLQLQETRVGDAGLASLAGHPRLEVLNLYGTSVTDAGLAHLERLPALRRVYLWRTEVTPQGVERLRARRPDLEIDTGWVPPPPEEKQEATWENVAPLLSGNCYQCHGPDEAARKAGLRLDTLEGATALLESGNHGIVPGEPDRSAVLTRIAHGDEDVRMPPAGMGPRLKPAEVDLIRRWIESGAEFSGHWSFRPPDEVTPPDPDPAEEGEKIGAIDAFVRERLRAEGLSPSPEADRYTLARRLSLDLRGLPADASEIEAFVNDDASDAYERLVDRFLDDPAFGERWTSSWLDLARYADTKGYEQDGRRTIWPYRDWVVRAINRDLPFDRFTVEQLAGDLLPESERDHGALIATAFHRNTMTNDEGGTDDEEFRSAAVVDRVNTTMQVWMGLSFGCAQCHDHKYDPISNEEYYQVYAVFNQTEDADRNDEAPLLEAPTPQQRELLTELESTLAEKETALARRTAEAERDFPEWLSALRSSAVASPSEGLQLLAPGDETSLREASWLDGEAATAPGVASTAARLDGVRALDLGDFGDFERDQPFSLALWMQRQGDDVHVPLARMDVPNVFRGWDLYVWEGKVHVHLIHAWPDNAIRIATTERIPDATWTHVAVTWDGSSRAAGLAVHINGELVPTTTTHDTLTETIRTERSLLVGRRHGGPTMKGMVDDVRVYERVLTPDEVGTIVRAGLFVATESAELEPVLRDVALRSHGEYGGARQAADLARSDVDTLRSTLARVPVLRELAGEARRTTRIHVRGSFLAQGAEVRAAAPAAFHDPGRGEMDRLAFARWLVADENPLTARVQVNRLWGELFGSALVETIEDFGTQGARPSHPELLDWLARDFVASGWSWKQLCRRIVTSATYRQSSRMRTDALELDPHNELLWRGPRHRLSAEMVRDQALAVAGLLSRKMFGPPVFPPQPDEVWQVVYSGDSWATDEGEDRWRRGLYTFWRRTSPYPSMIAFDAPSREFCVSRRLRTNTPLQAFVTLNDPVFLEAAQALARRIAASEGGTAERAARAFTWCTGHPPSEAETEALVRLYRSELEHYAERGEDAVLLANAEENAVELAAWTVVGNVLFNLDEVLVKG